MVCEAILRSRLTYSGRLWFSTSTTNRNGATHFKLVVVGGGSGGCTIGNKFGSKHGKENVAIIEPKDVTLLPIAIEPIDIATFCGGYLWVVGVPFTSLEIHYYQPLWTLVGAGLKKFDHSSKRTVDVIRHAKLIKDEAVKIDPKVNSVFLKNSTTAITYDYLVVACGLELRFDLIKGLPESFNSPGVCSNYHPEYVKKTLKAIEEFKSGNAIFTFPNTPIKCPGAPQKIMYLVEDHFRKGKRQSANVIYNTSLGVIFGIPKYAAALNDVCKRRDITVNLRHVLTEVRPASKEAIFSILNAQGKTMEEKSFKYELLHIGPPCSAPPLLRNAPELVDATGYLAVDRETLRHKKFENIFGIGDCINAPGVKTAAAVASQAGVLRRNLNAAMSGQPVQAQYAGYTSCPLVTSSSQCIMAEFSGYTSEPMETFPFDQGKEMRIMYWIKASFLPFLYWNLFLPGWWEGPAVFRKIFHFGR